MRPNLKKAYLLMELSCESQNEIDPNDPGEPQIPTLASV